MSPCQTLFYFSLLSFASFSLASANKDISSFMIVDCLLPGQVRQLGSMRYIAARKAIKTNTSDCEIRGGEYVAFDRANMASSLNIWLPLAKEGNAEAQNYVGEIYEKGQGVAPDYASAALWYFQAAEQDFSRAAINLGQLFEKGLGLDKDLQMATFWYRQASGIKNLSFKIKTAETELKYKPKKKPQKKTKAIKITVVEPLLKKNDDGFYSLWEGGDLLIIGEVKSETKVNEVLLNGKKIKLIGGSLFRGKISPKNSHQSIVITAKNSLGNESQFQFYLQASVKKKMLIKEKTKKITNTLLVSNSKRTNVTRDSVKYGLVEHNIQLGKGKYYALIIGNNRYKKVVELETAVNDAQTLAKLLKTEYAFITRLLIDADRYTILSELNKMGKKLKAEDKLLLYYAGHGELDRVNKRGHWLPIDAEADSMANWISNISITDMLNTLASRQLIVIADSCYSGMMSRSVLGIVNPRLDNSKRSKLLQAMVNARTRTGFSSGGVTPVIDSLDGTHSIFAISLLDTLQKNRGAMTGYEIFKKVRADVKKSSQAVGFIQVPEYAPLKYAGHESGDFVFIKIKKD